MKTSQPANDRRVILSMSAAALFLCAVLAVVVWKVIPTLTLDQNVQGQSIGVSPVSPA